ncbi:hypothetical protein ES703_53262 [subsurface metagenome]
MIKVYYVPSSFITREYWLIKQGLVNNSKVELVDNEKASDFVFLFYTALGDGPQSIRGFPPDKTIFLDYDDRHHLVFSGSCLAYFKRSWVEMVKEGNYTTKRPVHRPPNFYPLMLAIMDEFIIDENIERDVVLSCTIRPQRQHRNRPRVLEFVKKINIQGKKQIGALNQGTMLRFNAPDMREYFRLLRRSRIVVTCNPSKWEGDHRTWEAFANGALVFVDKMYTPMTHPLVDGKHCIFYELSDSGLNELRKKILYFLEETAHADDIARAGFDFTMRYHRASNRIDEILNVIQGVQA